MRPTPHLLRRTLPAALLALAALPVGARAAGGEAGFRVWFAGGRSVEATAIETGGSSGLWRFQLPGGGAVSVPADQVLKVRVLDPSPDEAEPAPLPKETGEIGSCDPVTDPKLARWDPLLSAAASRHGLDLDLVRAVVSVESCGDPLAVSRAGAIGLMQLMPATAADYGCTDPTDPEANVEAGCRHLARLHDKLDGSLELVLAAYNAGEGTVARHGGIPRWPETQRYVKLVQRRLERMQAVAATPGTAG